MYVILMPIMSVSLLSKLPFYLLFITEFSQLPSKVIMLPLSVRTVMQLFSGDGAGLPGPLP